MKWYFDLKLTFRKAVDQDAVTDPPIVLYLNPKTGFSGTNYEHDLSEAMKDIKEQIDSFESNGSGWI